MEASSERGKSSRPVRRKALGQHHLRSGSLCRPLLDFLEPLAGQSLLEIGPGGGVLTRELLAAGAQVVAWELDRSWALHTARVLGGSGLRLVVGDALALPWDRLPATLRVCGNLPYAVATPLIGAVLERALAVDRAAFMVQLEVAERLAAGPGSKRYGALSVLAAARADVRLLGRLGPRAFVPPPRVDSAFVGLVRRAPPLPEAEMAGFREVVFAAFAQRRKTIRNSLAANWGREGAEQALAGAGIAPERRAEQLDLAELVELYRAARGAPCETRQSPR